MTEFRFGKINLRVRDVDAAVEYTREVLGGEIIRQPHPSAFGKSAVVSIAGLLMEIVEPSPNTPLARNIEKLGEGIDSVGFFAESIDEVGNALEKRGARMVKPTGGEMANTVWVHPKNPLSMSMEFLPGSPEGVTGNAL